MFEVSGKIKVVFDEQAFPSGFIKREFVITTGHEKYPQDLKFEVVKDKCGLLDQFADGQDVTVHFDIRGNEFNGKYYVSLSAWKVLSAGSQGGQQQSAPPRQQAQRPASRPAATEPPADDYSEEDDIPF